MPTLESYSISPYIEYDSDFDLPFPSGVASGDLLLIVAAGFGTATGVPTATNATYPFTVLVNAQNDRGVLIAARLATGAETGNVLVDFPGFTEMHCAMLRISGHGVSTIAFDILTAVNRDSTDSPQVTGATDGSMAVLHSFSKGGTAPVLPSGFSDDTAGLLVTGNPRWHVGYDEETSGTTLGTYSWTNTSLSTITVAIPPAASGSTITGSGAADSDDASASGTAEREETSSGTPAAQASDTSGTAERELTGSGTPTAQAGNTGGVAERVLTCSGTLLSGASSTTGVASLQLRLLLTAAEGRELRDEEGALVASLANISYEWYDKDTDTNGDPDMSGTFNTDANGEATIQLPGTALTAGQYGLLVLEHPSDNTIRGIYRIPVS